MREGVALRSAVSVGRAGPVPSFFMNTGRAASAGRGRCRLCRAAFRGALRTGAVSCAKKPAHARGPGAFMLPGRPGRVFRLRAGLRQELARERRVLRGASSGSKARQHRRRSLPPCTGASLRTASCAGSAMLRPLRAGRLSCPCVFVFGPRRSPKKSPQRSGLRIQRRTGRRAKKAPASGDRYRNKEAGPCFGKHSS